MSIDGHMRPRRAQGDRFTVQFPEGWAQGRALFGGLVCGAVARAMDECTPEDRPMRSFAATFVRPSAPGPAQIEVQLTGAGRSATHAEARLSQVPPGESAPRLRLSAQATFAAARPSAITLQAPRPPSVPAPDTLQPLPYIPGITPEFLQHADLCFAIGTGPFSGATVAELGGWCRFHRAHTVGPQGPLPLDIGWILALLDAWPSPILTVMSSPAPASSASLFAKLTPEAMAGRTADDWFLFRSRSTTAQGGWADLQADLWASDGTHLATMRQLTAYFA